MFFTVGNIVKFMKNNFLNIQFFFQIFSKSTASALLNYKNYFEDLQFCEATADFCMVINNLFDSLNRTKSENGVNLESSDFKVRRLII